jgi:hypothetical protein
MNQSIDEIEREWQAQESAMRLERLNLDPRRDGTRSRHYRLLARVLRQPPQDGLPADFATRVAARAGSAPSFSSRFEFVLIIALAVALVGGASYAIATHGREWLPSFSAILPAREALANGWLMALCGCLGASWMMERWQRRNPRLR